MERLRDRRDDWLLCLCGPSPLLSILFDHQIIPDFEDARNATGSDVGDIAVAFVRHNSFQNQPPTTDDDVNRGDWLLAVAEERRVEIEKLAEDRPPYAIVVRRKWQNLDLVYHSVHAFDFFDAPLRVLLQRRPGHLPGQENRAVRLDLALEPIEDAEERQRDKLLANLFGQVGEIARFTLGPWPRFEPRFLLLRRGRR